MLKAMVVSLACVLYPMCAEAVLIPYQGWLTESDQPVTGSRNMTFSFHPDSTGDSTLFTQGPEAVTVIAGVYHVRLAPPLSLFGASQLWFGISVEGQALSPRIKVGAVPFAAVAATALSPSPVGVAYEGADTSGTIPFDDWFPVANLMVNCPAQGFVIVSFNCTITDLGTGGMQGSFSLDIDSEEGMSPVPFKVISSQNGTVLPVFLTRIFPVTAGAHTFSINARNPDWFDDEVGLQVHATSAVWVPLQYGQ